MRKQSASGRPGTCGRMRKASGRIKTGHAPGPERPLAAKTQVLGKMRELYTRTQVCLEILQRKSNRAAAELRSLSKAKLAITAYNTQQGRRG